MARAPNVLIHIGYHKTATTWFQSAYFPTHPEIATPFELEDVLRRIVRPAPTSFDVKKTRTEFEADLAKVPRGKTAVLSMERLSGNPHSGGFDARDIADRLVDTFPGCRVWAVVREQGSAIASNYRQYVRVGGRASLKHYLRATDNEYAKLPQFRAEHFEYAPLLRHYRERLGKNRLLVTTYEGFVKDSQGTLDAVCKFAGVPAHAGKDLAKERRNPGLSDLAVSLVRFSNAFRRDPELAYWPWLRIPGARTAGRAVAWLDRKGLRHLSTRRLEKRVRTWAGSRYADSNQQLASEFGLPLADHGYVLA